MWTPYGNKENGTIFVTAQRTEYAGSRPAGAALNNFFVSYDSGENWSIVNNPVSYYENNDNRPAYSNSMCLSRDGKNMYVVNTVQSKENSVNNLLTFANVDLQKSLKNA